MSRSSVLLSLGAASLARTFLSGCGSDSTTAEASTSPLLAPAGELFTTLDREGHHLRDLPAADAPTVAIEVTRDHMGGYNLHTTTDNFTWAPQHAGGDHIPGEGHAHIYVDGEKAPRVHSEWFFIGPTVMEPGMHEVTVTVNGNDHSQYSADGRPVEATVEVLVEDMAYEYSH